MATTSKSAEQAACNLVSTKAGNATLNIKPEASDSAEAREFLATCVNPYTKKYAGNEEAAKEGLKKFRYWSCSQCHGPTGGGQTGPSIHDDRWQYAKHSTDKGMFETIAGGSDAGMPAWHKQVSGNVELMPTDDILKIIAHQRTQFQGTNKPWLDEKPS